MESRAAWARSRSSAASASVTRTPTVRPRRSSSPSRGLAMVSLPALQGVQGDRPLARVYVKHKHILLLLLLLKKISDPVGPGQGKKTGLGPFGSGRIQVLPHPKKPCDDNTKKYKDIY